MERSQILKESGELYDNNCVGCRKWAVVAKQKHHSKAQEFCENRCVIGKRMKDLGDYLTYGRPTRVARDLIKEVYMEERERGLTDREIEIKYKISNKVLWKRKNFWKLTGNASKQHVITKAEYLDLKEQGYPDYFIAKKKRIGVNTLSRYKGIWGIQHNNDVNTIKEGPNGEEISFEMFDYYRAQGWTNFQIYTHWGIGRTTLRRKINAWRNCGYDVDKYSNRQGRGILDGVGNCQT